VRRWKINNFLVSACVRGGGNVDDLGVSVSGPSLVFWRRIEAYAKLLLEIFGKLFAVYPAPMLSGVRESGRGRGTAGRVCSGFLLPKPSLVGALCTSCCDWCDAPKLRLACFRLNSKQSRTVLYLYLGSSPFITIFCCCLESRSQNVHTKAFPVP